MLAENLGDAPQIPGNDPTPALDKIKEITSIPERPEGETKGQEETSEEAGGEKKGDSETGRDDGGAHEGMVEQSEEKLLENSGISGENNGEEEERDRLKAIEPFGDANEILAEEIKETSTGTGRNMDEDFVVGEGDEEVCVFTSVSQ